MTVLNSTARIDVHQHLVPPVWRKYLADRGVTAGGAEIPPWSARSAVAMMDAQGIAIGILSVTAPGVHIDSDADARTLARAVNEFGAEMAKDHPDRIGSFASIPLPAVDAALEEAVYALDVLGADGVVLMSSAHGRYLGDPDYEPLWAELDRRGAVVFIHPNQPALPHLDDTPAPLMDFLLDTTRAAVQMVLNGVMDRHRDVKVILAHGGGFVPYAAYRFSTLSAGVYDTSQNAEQVIRDFKRFYYDTALSSSRSSLPSLLAFAEPGHVLYGSDWPFAPESVGSWFNHELQTYAFRDDGDAAAIDRASAELLFPRLTITAHAGTRSDS